MLHSKLNMLDFPTFGRPTMPIFTWLPGRPRRTRFTGSSFFLPDDFAAAWSVFN